MAALLAVAPAGALAQTLIATVPVGTYPGPLAINPVTNKIYVLNLHSNNVTIIDGATNQTSTVATGNGPNAIAVDSVANKIYVTNTNAGSMTVIDGASNRTSTVSVGLYPYALAVNSATSQIYVSNYTLHKVTVIDGRTLATSSVVVGTYPMAIAVNENKNKVYVAGYGTNDVTVIDGATRQTTTVAVGGGPKAIAINAVTNQIYVANYLSNNVSVINGSNNSVSTVTVGSNPVSLAVDPILNRIYVANLHSNDTTIIDGRTLATSSAPAGNLPNGVDVNPLMDKAYFSNSRSDGTVTMLLGRDDSAVTISVGTYPAAIAVNRLTNRIYVANQGDNTVSVLAGAGTDPLQFLPVTPCRVVDTRRSQGPLGGPALAGGHTRSFPLQLGDCNLPSTAVAYALNVTVVPNGRLGYLTLWPTGQSQPVVSTLNSDGRVKANAAIVSAGNGGEISVYATDTTNLVLDVTGYFESAAGAALQFYPVTPCRLLDTRNEEGPLGGPHLSGGQERDFPVQSSRCGIPANAQAYSMSLTVVPWLGKPLGFLTVWGAGSSRPVVSTLNNTTGTVLANAAIVPAGNEGAIAVYSDQDTQLIADIDGYFAPPGPGGYSFYPVLPCRVIDTRTSGGMFSGERSPSVNVSGSPCGTPASAKGYVFNATVVPVGRLGYLTLWPDGEEQPLASALNAPDGVVTSNMAVVPTQNGHVEAYANGTTQLVLDISGYFAP